MKAEEIRKKFLSFFEKRGHRIIPSASLVPESDPSVLFTTAGMQQLVPYLLGQPHPLGKRLVNVQKCARTQDIDEVGDNTHDTFFEMLGNWSLGDYFKEEAIAWTYEFLISKKEGLGLDPNRIYITVFAGNKDAPRDEESKQIWNSLGVPEHRIYFLEDNWWSPGDNGPCGPDTEIFYDLTEKGLGDLTREQYFEAEKKQNILEIGNNVFIEYEKKDGEVVGQLKQRSVDFGGGLERLAAAAQKKTSIFETDLFEPVMFCLNQISNSADIKAKRIIADHIRTATFMIADGVKPSNVDRGYVLRRLIRRARYYLDSIGARDKKLASVNINIPKIYKSTDYDLDSKIIEIETVITDEEMEFSATLAFGKKLLEKVIKMHGKISGEDAFMLYSTYGYPFELIKEIAKENNIQVDEVNFTERKEQHRKISRAGAEQKFKGGLANTNEKTVRLHTAHHLLLAALQEKFGKGVKQKGSNINEERLRMDFSFDRKLTPEELKEIEDRVNNWIREDLSVEKKEMEREEAEKMGAEMEFGTKYPKTVSVYFIQDDKENAISREFCGGPHTKSTGQLGKFKIRKEEATSSGVRRIKATLE